MSQIHERKLSLMITGNNLPQIIIYGNYIQAHTLNDLFFCSNHAKEIL